MNVILPCSLSFPLTLCGIARKECLRSDKTSMEKCDFQISFLPVFFVHPSVWTKKCMRMDTVFLFLIHVARLAFFFFCLFNCFRFAFEIRLERVCVCLLFFRSFVRSNANEFTLDIHIICTQICCIRCDYNRMHKITFIGNLSVCSCVFCCRSIWARAFLLLLLLLP